MNNRDGLGLFGRYVFLAVLGIFNLSLFYYVFTPLTVQPAFWILSMMYQNTNLLAGNIFFFDGFYAQIIEACVAGAAYYLLLILNLSTPMGVGKRIKSISFLFITFLILNVARIVIFSSLLASGYQYFDIAHEITWYLGSTIMVALIWFVNVWIFKINDVPIYTDVRNIVMDLIGRA